MFRLNNPSTSEMHRLLDSAESEQFTYTEVGATAGRMPGGYRHDHWSTDLGPDDSERFHRAVEALMHWRPQIGAGLRVFPEAPVEDGATFILVISLIGPCCATAAGRVAYVIDEPERRGFAYGTLESHPEQGEEALVVVRDSGRIRFEITAFSRPRHVLARAGFLFTRWLQVQVNGNYLRAMQKAV